MKILASRTCGWYVGELAKGDPVGGPQKANPPELVLTGIFSRSWLETYAVEAGGLNDGAGIEVLGDGEENVNGKSWSAKEGIGAEGVLGESNVVAVTEGTVAIAVLMAVGAGGDCSSSKRISRASGCQ